MSSVPSIIDMAEKKKIRRPSDGQRRHRKAKAKLDKGLEHVPDLSTVAARPKDRATKMAKDPSLVSRNENLDRRTYIVRRVKEIADDLIEDRGGLINLSGAQKYLIRQTAWFIFRFEQLQEQMAIDMQNGMKLKNDDITLQMEYGVATRAALGRLGITRQARTIQPTDPKDDTKDVDKIEDIIDIS